jgi:hypothetical protein
VFLLKREELQAPIHVQQVRPKVPLQEHKVTHDQALPRTTEHIQDQVLHQEQMQHIRNQE